MIISLFDVKITIGNEGDSMETVKILHCADLHIGANQMLIGEKGQTRKYEPLLTFEKIIKFAKLEGVQLLLIAGDLFSSNSVELSAINRVLDCIASIPETQVVFAAGNHDPFNFQSPFANAKLPDNFHILPEEDSVICFDNLNTCVYGRSFSDFYMQGEPRFTIKPKDDYINIMCQHGEIKSDLSSNYNSITNEFIDSCGMDYIALGHIHKRSEIERRQNTFFAYSGCAEGLGFDELGDKGVYIGDIGKGVCNLKFFKTSIRTHERVEIDVSNCSDSAKAAELAEKTLKEKYSDSFADNLYKIILTGNVTEGSAFDTDEIAVRLSRIVYFVKVKDQTEVIYDLDTLKQENSLKGIFVSKMLKRINESPDDKKLRLALDIGLKAFSSEVAYNED